MLDTKSLSFTAFKPADLPQVRALHALSFQSLASGAHSAQQIHAHVKYMHTDEYADDLDRSNLQCALDGNGDLIATAGWVWMDEAPTTARLRKVFVHPDNAGTGLGRTMVERVEGLAKDSGSEDYFVRANINAKGFYQRLGYAPIKPGTMDVMDGISLPIMFMHKG
ncbi:GNAT family N-acetyltransferase [Magnetovibrio sp. PR-2]|uniref:GNAT family N-acetyltransferase n=1 Tax=Magnetovibrio sp. PR-2 TaxID=3120356 RepID=UPI002FCDE736